MRLSIHNGKNGSRCIAIPDFAHVDEDEILVSAEKTAVRFGTLLPTAEREI
jgi:hypothetical protein